MNLTDRQAAFVVDILQTLFEINARLEHLARLELTLMTINTLDIPFNIKSIFLFLTLQEIAAETAELEQLNGELGVELAVLGNTL